MPLTDEAAPASPCLSPGERALILRAAAGHVVGAVLGRPPHEGEPVLGGLANVPVAGAYVTLKRRGHLRGCCGTLGVPKPLGAVLGHAARRTARDDPRLPPVSPGELPYLDLSVNLVFGLAPVSATGGDRVGAVTVGRHGLRVRRGEAGGLLLPGVAVEHGWDAESFLRHVCRKAGLPTTAWRDEGTELFTFESDEFGGPLDMTVPGAVPIPPPARLDPGLLRRAAEDARGNAIALARGAAPVYYPPGAPDGDVNGVALTLHASGRAGPSDLAQFSFRPGLPLQATLLGLCESAARALGRDGPEPRSLRVGLTVFTDPAVHGTAADPDLRGLDPARRALLLVDRGRPFWAYDPSATPEGLLAAVLKRAGVVDPGRAGLYGLEAQSTEGAVVSGSTPRPDAGDAPQGARPPAVAGRFYPSDPAELSAQVEGLLGSTPRRPGRWPAAMVPHAGLKFSGGVAAAVLNRLEIPDLVIVVGPKHTRDGADWAVMPDESWAIPGARVPSDPALARDLADAVPGLRLDTAAHRNEHAIEVELPFLARLAPGARVVGVAVGGGDWEHCRRFAHGLAGVVARLPTPPLLLISSDMNHFANDRETRALDEIALAAMARLDPRHLLETVVEHGISMCGVLPAVIVMETLRRLGGLSTSERVAYATSADVTGDPRRVVGYAGVLLA